jgi:hypothetical protein
MIRMSPSSSSTWEVPLSRRTLATSFLERPEELQILSIFTMVLIGNCRLTFRLSTAGMLLISFTSDNANNIKGWLNPSSTFLNKFSQCEKLSLFPKEAK